MLIAARFVTAGAIGGRAERGLATIRRSVVAISPLSVARLRLADALPAATRAVGVVTRVAAAAAVRSIAPGIRHAVVRAGATAGEGRGAGGDPASPVIASRAAAFRGRASSVAATAMRGADAGVGLAAVQHAIGTIGAVRIAPDGAAGALAGGGAAVAAALGLAVAAGSRRGKIGLATVACVPVTILEADVALRHLANAGVAGGGCVIQLTARATAAAVLYRAQDVGLATVLGLLVAILIAARADWLAHRIGAARAAMLVAAGDAALAAMSRLRAGLRQLADARIYFAACVAVAIAICEAVVAGEAASTLATAGFCVLCAAPRGTQGAVCRAGEVGFTCRCWVVVTVGALGGAVERGTSATTTELAARAARAALTAVQRVIGKVDLTAILAGAIAIRPPRRAAVTGATAAVDTGLTVGTGAATSTAMQRLGGKIHASVLAALKAVRATRVVRAPRHAAAVLADRSQRALVSACAAAAQVRVRLARQPVGAVRRGPATHHAAVVGTAVEARSATFGRDFQLW